MDSWLVKYVDVLENLNADNLDSLRHVTADSIHFKDPFNDRQTQEGFMLIMEDMFKQLPYVRFKVHRSVQMDQEAFIHWNFEGNSRLTGEFNFDGISLLKVDDAGKIILHHDIWDGSALMERIPFVRGIIRTLRKKLSHQ